MRAVCWVAEPESWGRYPVRMLGFPATMLSGTEGWTGGWWAAVILRTETPDSWFLGGLICFGIDEAGLGFDYESMSYNFMVHRR